MAKRSQGIASPVVPGAERPVPRRTERSHEENQERAYIAASRRADRSIEARVQSARMASEIHKRRTGKGFKITEEIVIREEMYEEEEDDFPRHYRTFAAHLHTSSPDMNNRLNAYVANQVAIANLARQQEVDRLFAEQFPGVAQAAQSAQYHHYAGRPPPHMNQPHNMHNFHAAGPVYPRDRTHSMPDVTPMSPISSYNHVAFQNYHHPSPSTRHTSIDGQISPGDSPAGGSTVSRTISTPITSYSGEDTAGSSLAKQHSSGIPVDPSLTISTLPAEATDSSFTSKLPAETRLMIGDIHDQIVSAMYDGELMGSDQYFVESQYEEMPTYSQTLSGLNDLSQNLSFDYPEPQSQSTHLGNSAQPESQGGTPSANVDWEQWLNN